MRITDIKLPTFGSGAASIHEEEDAYVYTIGVGFSDGAGAEAGAVSNRSYVPAVGAGAVSNRGNANARQPIYIQSNTIPMSPIQIRKAIMRRNIEIEEEEKKNR